MTQRDKPIVVWFRDDLRLGDHPALWEAAGSGRPLLCVFNFDTASEGLRALGGAARWWLHGALEALDEALAARGGGLALFRGAAVDMIPRIAAASSASAVFWNRRYGLAERRIDEAVKSALARLGIAGRSFNGHLIHEPWTISNSEGKPFRVFSAFWRAAARLGPPAAPLPSPETLRFARLPDELSRLCLPLSALALEPAAPDWAAGLRQTWQRGEAGARRGLKRFLEDGFAAYAANRDLPAAPATSRLSPYLRFGNISVRQVWHAATAAAMDGGPHGERNLEKFLSELGWREFSYHLLYHHPDLAQRNFQSRFDRMPWRDDAAALSAWQKGRTGYPLVDAGMRELWATGWMHNRVRMVAASFLTKHLLIDWRAGEAWFWDTLVDADPANNPASWQWVAGCGADAAPYFRIFNPVLQGEKFDPDGSYVRRWVPELQGLSRPHIHRPWTAAPTLLARTGIPAGAYPQPIVDHDRARNRALDAYRELG